MKRFLFIAIMALFSIISFSQVVKTVNITENDNLEDLLGYEKYQIDSLVLKGYMRSSDFGVLRDCITAGVLSGIDMSECSVEGDSIPGKAFYDTYYTKFDYITLPKNLKHICKYAFYNNKINNITLPQGLERIEPSAFYVSGGNTENLVLPEGLTFLGESAFFTTKFKRITLPSTLKEIPEYAFAFSTAEEVEFKEGLEKVGIAAFSSIAVKELVLPQSLVEMRPQSFAGCYYVEKLVLPADLEVIPDYNFNQCYSLKQLVLPKNLKRIEDESFKTTGNLKELILPEGLTHIGKEVFSDIPSLELIVLPSTLEFLDEKSFDRSANNLKAVYSKSVVSPLSYFDTNTGVKDDYDFLPFKGLADDAVLYIPVGSTNNYNQRAYFKRFKTVKETADFPTGIGAVETVAAGCKVSGEKGAISIVPDGRTADYAVYRADGTMICSGRATDALRLQMPAGVYAVRAGGMTVKVIVR